MDQNHDFYIKKVIVIVTNLEFRIIERERCFYIAIEE